MTVVNNASVIFKDKNGNVGKVKAPSANDITKISTAISDVAQVVDPTSHLPINATTSSVGVVQLADATAVAAGTAGRIIDAAQLKDAIEHVTPAGNFVTLSSAQYITGLKTFNTLPESSVVPTTDNQFANKKYVDDHTSPLPTNMMTTDTAQTVSAVKTFSTLPESSVAPSTANQLTNKTYVDSKADIYVDGTYVAPSANNSGIIFTATDCITAPGSGSTFVARGVKTGSVELFAGASVPEGYLLCNGAAVSRTLYADLFAAIGTIYGAGDGSTTFNVPDFRDRYPIGVGTNSLGTKLAEQLPNITGKFAFQRATTTSAGVAYDEYTTGWANNNYIATGAFKTNTGLQRDASLDHAVFDSSLSNSIYTDSGKVYPLSLALNFIIKA